MRCMEAMEKLVQGKGCVEGGRGRGRTGQGRGRGQGVDMGRTGWSRAVRLHVTQHCCMLSSNFVLTS
jgi:hypothetical protein